MYIYKAVVRSVYDGDSIRADLHLGFGIVDCGANGKGRAFRLYGIDTPEVNTGSSVSKKEGRKSRDYVRGLLPEGTVIMIESIKDRSGKYGRYLAKIFVKDGFSKTGYYNLNELLVIKGLAIYKDY